jgi:hypothetical protein
MASLQMRFGMLIKSGRSADLQGIYSIQFNEKAKLFTDKVEKQWRLGT